MPVASLLILAQTETQYNAPGYFQIVLIGLLILGAVGWLIAAVLGFARARAFGAATRWFSLAAVCLIAYHLQFLLLALAVIGSPNMLLSIGAFFNLFVVLGSVCAIMGFVRLTDPR